MKKYSLQVNGEKKNVEVSEGTPILWVLRDELQLVGTKFGCGIAQCGSCTIHVDGKAIRSCVMSVDGAEGKEITTIEGLSKKGDHPLQEAWAKHDVPQCGYCQAGQIMTAASFLSENKNPSDKEIEDAMSGNLCRCSAYLRIKEAVITAAKS